MAVCISNRYSKLKGEKIKMKRKLINAGKLVEKINGIEEPKGLLRPVVHALKIWAEAMVMAEEVVDWIPIAPDTMPEDGECVLLTVTDINGTGSVITAAYDALLHLFTSNETGRTYMCDASYILGWMPAPEPMKKRSMT